MAVLETEVSIATFRANLSAYVEQAQRGQSVVLTSNGRPVARLLPPATNHQVPFGALAGQITIAADFDESDALISTMEEGPI